MIIYNVTIHIEKSSEKDFIAWMENEHIPEVLETKNFFKAVFLKVCENDNETGSTYSCQYFAQNRNNLELYYQENATQLRQKGKEKFGEKMIAFRTELEVLKEFI